MFVFKDKKIFVISLLVLLSLFFLNYKKSEAITFGYGGYNIGSLPCLCSVGFVWYSWFAPLHVSAIGTAITGPMAIGVPPLSVWYAFWDPIVPTTWSTGNFVPVWTCWQPGGPTGCHPWPTFGHVYMVGSSIPFTAP